MLHYDLVQKSRVDNNINFFKSKGDKKNSDQSDTAIAIVNSFGVGKTQIQNKIKVKGAILERWHGGRSGDLDNS